MTAAHTPAAKPRRRIGTGWVLLLLLTLLYLLLFAALASGLEQGLPDLPWAIVVNGQEVWHVLQLPLRDPDTQLGVAALIALLITIALVLVPLMLVLAAVMAVLLPVLAAGLAVLLAISPLLAVGALLWWLLRPSRSASIKS